MKQGRKEEQYLRKEEDNETKKKRKKNIQGKRKTNRRFKNVKLTPD